MVSKKTQDISWLVFRVVVGLMFMLHGVQKLFGALDGPGLTAFASFAGVPVAIAAVAGGIEFFGGLLIAIGLFTRIAAFFSGIEIAVAYVMAHAMSGKGFLPLANGGELAVMYFVAFLVIYAMGPGRWAVDNVMKK